MDEVKKWAMEKAEMLLNNSGAINFADFDNDYELPKILLGAILPKAPRQFGPLNTKNKNMVANLKQF